MSSKMSFKTGHAVFYPSAGVGVVEGKEDIYLSGQRECYYVIRILESGARIKVPCVNVEQNGIRPLLDGKNVKELFRVLCGTSRRRPTTGNPAERTRELARKVNTGSCLEIGEVVRDLLQSKCRGPADECNPDVPAPMNVNFGHEFSDEK